jgi:hypothetical protein
MTSERRSREGLWARATSLPVYPTIFVVAFVVDFWSNASLDATLLIRPVIVAVVIGVIVTAAGIVITQSRHKGGVVAGVAAVGIVGGDDRRLIALALVAVIAIVILGLRERTFARRIPWFQATRALNILATALLVVLTVNAASALTRSSSGAAVHVEAAPAPSAKPPDIVVLLLDAHARADVLAEDYDADMSEFVNALEQRGFDVSSRSRSNYMSTQLTLPSMFNLNLLSDLKLPDVTDRLYGPALNASLVDNEAFRILREGGYRIGAVSPGYEGVALRKADSFFDGGQLSELETILIANSAALPAIEVAAPTALQDQLRARIRWNLNPDNWLPQMESTAAGQPFFLFVHVPSPHPPYVFYRDGSPRQDRVIFFVDRTPFVQRTQESIDSTAEAYVGQLTYVDTMAIAAIDKVLDAVPDDAVVIVMADHGPDAHVDWSNLTPAISHERFAALFAARTPGHADLFGDAPTPVNLFRTLFNTYLGTDLTLLSDDSFMGIPPEQLVDIGDPDDR